MTAPDDGPTGVASVAAVGGAVVALLAVGPYSPGALAAGVLGAGLVVAGLVRRRHSTVSLGALASLGGVLLGGGAGAPPLPLLVGTVATVFAWDVGRTAIALGGRLGRAADTVRLEVRAAVSSAAVGLVAGGLAYVVYLVGPARQSAVVLLGTFVGAVLLVLAFE